MVWCYGILHQVLAPVLQGAPTHRKSAMSSVFSLFNLKEKSRFWTESVIHGDFDDLETSSPGKNGALNYSRAGNIANYLRLQEVDSMYLPVPVNFIFIGFEGKGNEAFRLQPEEIERWFSKIDHIFEHTRVPQIEEVLNPFYKINVDKGNHHLPTLSHINYNFSVHAIQMNEKVASVFEHAIAILSRKDDVSVDDKDALWQVDLDMMEVLFDSLVEYLQIGNAYNVFILNPRHDVNRSRYGYRRGLSESEIDFLKQNTSLQAKIRDSGKIPESTLAIEKIQNPIYQRHPMVKFSWTTTDESHTGEWSDRCSEALNGIQKMYQGKDTDYIIQSKILQVLHGKSEDLKLVLEKELKTGDFSGLHAECLTDTWIGKDRWVFVDLSAGPCTWGPAVGGQGVRTEQSLPNVTKTIGAVAEISEEEAEDRLQDAIQERFAVFGDREHEAIDILLAEIDIYELFAFKHCKGRKVKLALCEELDERMRELNNELQSMEGDAYDENHRRKAVDALRRMESWNLFSDTIEEFQNYTVARDNFLSHLGSTLWGSMRHVIAPSVADGAFHFYEQISYQLYFITQDKVKNIKHLPVDLRALMDGLSALSLPSQKVMFSQHMLALADDPALAMAFSVARRAAAVPMLLVNGTYKKTISNYLDSSIIQRQLQRVSDHSTLKGQQANSRSMLEIPIFWFIHGDTLLVDKQYQAKALSDMVIVVQSESSSWESYLQCNGRSLLLDLRRPVKAAVVAAAEHLAGLLPLHLVYSHAHETAIEDWIWSVGCNPFSITSQGWRISQFHLDTIARNYIITSLEESVQLVNSAVHRLVSVQTSILAMIANLTVLGTNSNKSQITQSDSQGDSMLWHLTQAAQKSFKLFQSQERDLVNKYNLVVGLWKRIATISGELRYVDALRLLYTLDDASRSFAQQVNTTIAVLHPINCTKDRKVEVEFDMTTIPAFLVVLLILWLVLRPRRAKPKIN
ncbi:hypothetical protein Cgig2_024428 [Carnegiea gigantea]|uniref:DUF7906 domain-containing protein n=1 Tax=Carnegiea gigantea TaxID=171969 RepID=A0A9Q1KL34_9CARY|nr:hypothetical protein Cgig2_024428 [Carnegiea gigantea]